MCIICIELEKSLISPLEAQRNLAEMAFDLDLDHFLEVQEKIQEQNDKNSFASLLKSKDDDDNCEICTDSVEYHDRGHHE